MVKSDKKWDLGKVANSGEKWPKVMKSGKNGE